MSRTVSSAPPRPLRVCAFGACYPDYPRNRMLLEGLRRSGAVVLECHASLWTGGTANRIRTAKGGWRSPAFLFRFLFVCLRLIWRHLRLPDYDVMLIRYPGMIDVLLGSLMAHLRGKPLVWDIFISTHLITLERGLDRCAPFASRMLQIVERRAGRLADRVLCITPEYGEWLSVNLGIHTGKLALLPMGPEDWFLALADQKEADGAELNVLYYGSVPNHGLPVILKAARLLADDPSIRFTLIGESADMDAAKKSLRESPLSGVSILPRIGDAQLACQIEKADICLGSFSKIPNSRLVVQHKTLECMAAGKAVITGDSRAARSMLNPGTDILVVERENAGALADAIRSLRRNPARIRSLGRCARENIRKKYSLEIIGRELSEILLETSNSFSGGGERPTKPA